MNLDLENRLCDLTFLCDYTYDYHSRTLAILRILHLRFFVTTLATCVHICDSILAIFLRLQTCDNTFAITIVILHLCDYILAITAHYNHTNICSRNLHNRAPRLLKQRVIVICINNYLLLIIISKETIIHKCKDSPRSCET